METQDGAGRSSAHDAALVFLLASGIGVLLFAYRYLEVVASGGSKPFLEPLVNEMTGAYSAALVFFPARAIARRFRLDLPGGYRWLPVHLPALALLGASATSLMWASRSLLYPLLGLGRFEYGRMPHRYFMEFPLQVIAYTLVVSGVGIVGRWHAERERALRLAQLEARLTRAQLQNLELQLQPHFLFNALNTISSTMYEDPGAADEMVGHLSDLLRLALRTQRAHEVSLRSELLALDHYLSLMRARFGDALRVCLRVEPATLDLRVPSLVLQPLVENAVRHGGAAAVGAGRIEVRARREGDRLRLEVEDDGPGAGADPRGDGGGLGLGLTRERLRLLYGEGHTMSASPGVGGGFLVSLSLPARPADDTGEAVP